MRSITRQCRAGHFLADAGLRGPFGEGQALASSDPWSLAGPRPPVLHLPLWHLMQHRASTVGVEAGWQFGR